MTKMWYNMGVLRKGLKGDQNENGFIDELPLV
jgi:hypothetical protein